MSRIALRTVHQPGLYWETDLFGEVAKWTKEPSIDIMKKLITQHLELENEPKLDFFAAGALNKLYALIVRRAATSCVSCCQSRQE